MAQKTWTGASSDGDWSNAANWYSTAVPGAGDDVRIPSGTGNITAGLDQSAVALGDVIVEDGYTGQIGSLVTGGSTSAYLQIDPDRFEFAGTGRALINLGSAAIPVEVRKTASAGTGERGLYLQGTGITTLSVESGSVGLASIFQSTATAAAVRVIGVDADVVIGEGAAVTQLDIYDGVCTLRSGSTNMLVNVFGGELRTEEEGPIKTLTQWGGSVIANSRGTIHQLRGYGGAIDFLQSGSTRTVADAQINAGYEMAYDPTVLGVSAWTSPNRPLRHSGVDI